MNLLMKRPVVNKLHYKRNKFNLVKMETQFFQKDLLSFKAIVYF